MHLRTDTVYASTVEDLWRACGTRDYVEAKYPASRIRHWVAGKTLIEVELERDVAVDRQRLPAWMRRWVPERQTLRHVSRWQRTGEHSVAVHMRIEPLHLPVRAAAEGELREGAVRSSHMALQWHVSSRVLPWIAHAVEAQFAGELREAMDEDRAITERYIAARRA